MNSSFRCLFRESNIPKVSLCRMYAGRKETVGYKMLICNRKQGPFFVPAAPLLITGSITVDIILMGHGGPHFSTQHSGGRWIRIARATELPYLNKQQNKKLWILSEIHCWATVTKTIINQYLTLEYTI